MAIIRFAGFSGEIRSIEPKLLPDTACTVSRNHKPGRGDMRPWKTPLTVASVPAGRQTIYRMGRDVASSSDYWLSWTGVVNAVRGFSATDTSEKTYYTGDGAPKFTDNVMALASAPYPTSSRPLGLPAPTAAPTVSGANSGDTTPTVETYFYVYTYVNDLGWESAPSPVSAMVERDNLGTTTISGFQAPPSGNYNITGIRIYKTQTGTVATSFSYLMDIAVGTSSATDTNQTLGEVIGTTGWLPAPGIPTGGSANITEPVLTGLTPMWAGMLAGISGNSVRICEPYTPYAWPVAYEILPPDSKPVGVGVFGQSMVVLTTGRPMVVAGVTPDGLDQQPIEMPQGCVAVRSIVSMGSGVAWASEDGLCWIGAGGARVVTMGLMLREDWQALVPSSIIGKFYEGLYFGSYDDGTGRKGFFLDPQNPTGIYFLDTGYTALHFDELRDQLYVLDGTSVKAWDAGTTKMTYRARSKLFSVPKPSNFGAAEVLASSYPMTFRLYADGVLKHTETVASRAPFRLPAGFLARDFQIELEGTEPVQAVSIANSIVELSQV